MRRFALKDVRVISVKEANNTMVLQKLGEVAAYYLDNLLNDNMILGISWGNTMYHTVKAVKTSKNIPITVVPIMGAANVRTPERDSLDLSKELAYAYGGTYHYIYAPLFVTRKKSGTVLNKSRILRMFRACKECRYHSNQCWFYRI